jgi:cellulose synthase/poly-beta-1,6-N-acetylglucosamine synthase-like glycosyltransferase
MTSIPFFNIGVMAYNEEKNIGFLLDKFIKQAEKIKCPFNITVVMSGCTDRTEDIVRTYENTDNRINLLIEKQRKGKASAINLFLKEAKGNLLIISSADIIPSDEALEKLTHAFSDSLIGMVGGRPIPKSSIGVMGLLNRLLWELHHEVALCQPKLGELIAIRNIINKVPEETAADEAAMEAIVTKKGFKIKYIPNVIIYNYGPKDLISFIKKRIRIFIGHLYVEQTMSYRVSTFSIIPLILAVIKKIKKEKKNVLYILILVCLEAYARAIAFFEYYIRRKTYHIWSRK